MLKLVAHGTTSESSILVYKSVKAHGALTKVWYNSVALDRVENSAEILEGHAGLKPFSKLDTLEG